MASFFFNISLHISGNFLQNDGQAAVLKPDKVSETMQPVQVYGLLGSKSSGGRKTNLWSTWAATIRHNSSRQGLSNSTQTPLRISTTTNDDTAQRGAKIRETFKDTMFPKVKSHQNSHYTPGRVCLDPDPRERQSTLLWGFLKALAIPLNNFLENGRWGRARHSCPYLGQGSRSTLCGHIPLLDTEDTGM